MIKLPKDFIDTGYKFESSIPTAKFETVRTPEGSLALRAWYETNEIEEFAIHAAREMNEKVEAAIMDELLKLNGYTPERTCRFRNDGRGILWCDEEGCDYEMDDYLPIPNYCPNCGAMVVQE